MYYKFQIFKLTLLTIFVLFSVVAFGQTTIISENFNSQPASWSAGGLGYVSNGNTIEGSHSLRIKNGETATSPQFNTSWYSSLTLSFSFRPKQMEIGDEIMVEFYDGTTWAVVASYIIDGATYSNSNNYLLNTVTINNPPTSFPVDAQFRFTTVSHSGNNSDRFFIDSILIEGGPYCPSYGNNVDGYTTGIRLVDFNTISNSTPVEDNDYSNFTALSTNVILGTSYDLTVNVNTDGNYENRTFAWIDWNQDGDFSDVGESYNLGSATNVSNGPTANSPLAITIPATASTGSTRMRVSTRYSNNPTSCDVSFDGEVEDYTINIISNIWNGSVNSDWNNSGNWSVGVPTIGVSNTLNVLISSGLTNYPILFAGDAFGYVENILFENNTTLNIIDNYIQITGNITLNGIIDLEGESQLLQETGSVFDVASTGSIEIDQQGTGNSFRYNYWCSPVNSTGTDYNIEGVLRDGTDATNIKDIDFGTSHTYADGAVTSPIKLSTYWMFKLEDSGLGYSAWERIGKDLPIKVGQGFTLKGSNTSVAEQNYTFVGKPNNGTISLSIAASNSYLTGNPYPSAIDSWQFIDDNDPLGTASIGNGGTLYFWEHYGGNTHNLKDYQGGYATLSKGGEVPAAAYPGLGGGSSVKGAPGRYIPVGQAFFVVGSTTGGTIEFNNGQRIFIKESLGNSVFMKSSATKSKISTTNKTDLRPKFRIGFEAPKIDHRQLLLTIDENTSDNVDWGYDAKSFNTVSDDMYWMIDDKKYVIQATNKITLDKEIPLGIQTEEGGLISIMVDALENVDENTSIYIKDKLSGETYNITYQAFEIYLEAGEYLERFVLTFQPKLKTLEEVALVEGVHIFMNNIISELQLNRIVDTEIVNVNLFNYLGQQVNTWNINTDERFISLPLKTATGVYIVNVYTTAGVITKKIIIE